MSSETLENQNYLLKEDIQCVHDYLDTKKIERHDLNGQVYSIVGRIKRLETEHLRQMSLLENHYVKMIKNNDHE